MSILLIILALVVLILVHEFGHFSVAKFFKIRVDEFGIFFPPRIAAVKKGETEYSINWLPFGGFVRIFGENPEDGASDPCSLAKKSRWIQTAVILAGIFFNLLFAWLLLSAGYMAGMPTTAQGTYVGELGDAKPTVVALLPNSPAEAAGMLPEDVIVGVETGTTKLNAITSAKDITDFIAAHADESAVITVKRDGARLTFLAKPKAGIVEGRKVLGVHLADVGVLSLPPHLALVQGGILTYQMVIETAQGLAGFGARLVRGAADFNQVAGPIGIVALGGTFVEQGYVALIMLTASISIALAVFNLLPIPGLDGGRLLFIIVEGIMRRPISKRLSYTLTAAGFALLITLMLIVSYHDIARLVS